MLILLLVSSSSIQHQPAFDWEQHIAMYKRPIQHQWGSHQSENLEYQLDVFLLLFNMLAQFKAHSSQNARSQYDTDSANTIHWPWFKRKTWIWIWHVGGRLFDEHRPNEWTCWCFSVVCLGLRVVLKTQVICSGGSSSRLIFRNMLYPQTMLFHGQSMFGSTRVSPDNPTSPQKAIHTTSWSSLTIQIA